MQKKLGQERAAYYRSRQDELEALPKRRQAAELTFARPDLFSDIERARDFIRAITGAGKAAKSANYGGLKKEAQSTIEEGIAKLRTFKETLKEPLSVGAGRILLLSDIHLPYHDVQALQTAVKYGKSMRPDTIILNGDVLDCYTISRFQTEISRPTLSQELRAGRDFLKLLRKEFPAARIIFKIGNHEERLRHYILRQARELHDLDDLRLQSLLGFDVYGVELVDREIIKAGKLNIMHGHEMGESVFSPVNPARGYFLKAKCSAIVGHYHQVSYHSESNLNGDEIGVWSVGCLCSLSPEYRPYAYTKWRHGFAIIDVEADGSFEVYNMQIINGKVR